MEYIFMLGFLGWLVAMISMVPSAPSYKAEDVVLDLGFAEKEADIREFRKAA